MKQEYIVENIGEFTPDYVRSEKNSNTSSDYIILSNGEHFQLPGKFYLYDIEKIKQIIFNYERTNGRKLHANEIKIDFNNGADGTLSDDDVYTNCRISVISPAKRSRRDIPVNSQINIETKRQEEVAEKSKDNAREKKEANIIGNPPKIVKVVRRVKDKWGKRIATIALATAMVLPFGLKDAQKYQNVKVPIVQEVVQQKPVKKIKIYLEIYHINEKKEFDNKQIVTIVKGQDIEFYGYNGEKYIIPANTFQISKNFDEINFTKTKTNGIMVKKISNGKEEKEDMWLEVALITEVFDDTIEETKDETVGYEEKQELVDYKKIHYSLDGISTVEKILFSSSLLALLANELKVFFDKKKYDRATFYKSFIDYVGTKDNITGQVLDYNQSKKIYNELKKENSDFYYKIRNNDYNYGQIFPFHGRYYMIVLVKENGKKIEQFSDITDLIYDCRKILSDEENYEEFIQNFINRGKERENKMSNIIEETYLLSPKEVREMATLFVNLGHSDIQETSGYNYVEGDRLVIRNGHFIAVDSYGNSKADVTEDMINQSKDLKGKYIATGRLSEKDEENFDEISSMKK